MKKKIYLVQVNVTFSDKISYIPYAAGCVAAYAFSDNEISSQYELSEIIFLRKRIQEVCETLSNPYMVSFSCYTWNIEYNKALAALIKKFYPNCIIVFSGHEIPNDTSYLEKYSYIDILTFGEGEETFSALLKALANGTKLDNISNLAFRTDESIVKTPVKYDFDISHYPSPYTMGLFDKMISDNPGISFNAILETNRGCPYGCSYCDWCFTKRIRYFDINKIKSEINWMSEKKLPYCYCADANFGISERDVEIAAYVIEKRRENGFPKIFKPCYAKESNDTVFSAGKLLNDEGADKGVTLAYQTLNFEALKNIERKNLTLDHFAELDARYASANIPTYTELILGMPGETYESFCHGMCYLLEKGQHNSMTVYNCQVYVNSPMGNPEYQKKYGIVTSRIPLHGIHYPANFNGVQEYFNVITQTETMPKTEWVKANLFSIILQAFHHLGLLRCFAIYLRKEMNVSYYDFYNKLLDFIFSDSSTATYALFEDIRSRIADTDTGDWTYQNDLFSPIGWYFEEGAFLDMAYRNESFWPEIEPFLRSFEIPADMFSSLYQYQKDIIRRPCINSKDISSDYDFYSYFEDIYQDKYSSLRSIRTNLHITMEKQINDWASYAIEIIWYGKRRSATLVTNPRENIRIEYSNP